jgi:predicted heme/steroid binding protein
LLAAVLIYLLLCGTAKARPEFARFTGKPCSACHVSAQGGGELKPEGEEFKRQLHDRDIPMDPNLRVSTGQRLLHLTLWFVHILFGAGWIGLFLYIFSPALRDRKLVIPSGPYTRQFLYCMTVILITGTALVTSKMKMVPDLFTTRFGLLLAVKISGALALAAATTVLLWYTKVTMARRCRLIARSLDAGSQPALSRDDLIYFKGSGKRKALVAVEGRVYDVTGRNLWTNGIHPGGHHAGSDLTHGFKAAPHGKEVLDRIRPVGSLVEKGAEAGKNPLRWAIPLGMVGSGLIILVVLMWRW